MGKPVGSVPVDESLRMETRLLEGGFLPILQPLVWSVYNLLLQDDIGHWSHPDVDALEPPAEGTNIYIPLQYLK